MTVDIYASTMVMNDLIVVSNYICVCMWIQFYFWFATHNWSMSNCNFDSAQGFDKSVSQHTGLTVPFLMGYVWFCFPFCQGLNYFCYLLWAFQLQLSSHHYCYLFFGSCFLGSSYPLWVQLSFGAHIRAIIVVLTLTHTLSWSSSLTWSFLWKCHG